MRTSQAQLETLVNFMTEYGDLSKPATNARGKMASFQRWVELTDNLNSDGSGDSKTTEKWKKVWSDYKNNTKKKAARIHRAATGTGGGSAIYAQLNHLELKVLNLIGIQAATGLPVEEAGLTQELQIEEDQERLQDSPSVPRERDTSSDRIFDLEYDANEPEPSHQPLGTPQSPTPTGPPSRELVDVQVDSNPVSDAARTPSPPPSQPGGAQGRPTQLSSRPQRRARLSRTDQAAQDFLNSDGAWRRFRFEQHRDYMEIRREKIRIREMELAMQRDWHNATLSALDLMRKLVDNHCQH